MINESKYWKCEYENLRRKNKKEIENMKIKQINFFQKTYRLLKLIGISDKEILEYYGRTNQLI